MEATTCPMPNAAFHDRAAAYIDAAIAAGSPIRGVKDQLIEQHSHDPEGIWKMMAMFAAMPVILKAKLESHQRDYRENL